MQQIKILGVGSPFGDDQVGWKVIDNLQKSYLNQQIILKKLDRPHLHLLDEMEYSEIVYIVDAMKSESSIGTIKRLTIDNIVAEKRPLSSHDFVVIHSLQLANALNQLPNQLVLFGVEIGKIDKSEKISEEVKKAISKVTNILTLVLENCPST